MMPLVKIRLIVLLAIPGLIAAAVPLAVMAQDAPRQTQVIEMIDETTLTVAELMALAAAERDAPTALSLLRLEHRCVPTPRGGHAVFFENRCRPLLHKRLRWTALAVHLEGVYEGFLRDIHLAELPHLLFPGLLLVQQLALARRVAAVAFRGHVLAQG